MAGERLAQLAVDAIVDWLDAQLQAYLTAVETARSMTAGTLTAPVDVMPSNLPDYGGATPLIEVWANAMQRDRTAGASNEVWKIDATLFLTHACDANIEGGEQFVRDYVTALIDCLESTNTGKTLNSRVGLCLVNNVSFFSGRGSSARHEVTAALELDVRVFD